MLQCRVWGATAVEEWPLNVLAFAAALAFVCDGSDDMLQSVLAATPAASEMMSSLTPFSSVDLKDNPTILSCLIESGFYRGPVLKPRPSFAKVASHPPLHLSFRKLSTHSRFFVVFRFP